MMTGNSVGQSLAKTARMLPQPNGSCHCVGAVTKVRFHVFDAVATAEIGLKRIPHFSQIMQFARQTRMRRRTKRYGEVGCQTCRVLRMLGECLPRDRIRSIAVGIGFHEVSFTIPKTRGYGKGVTKLCPPLDERIPAEQAHYFIEFSDGVW